MVVDLRNAVDRHRCIERAVIDLDVEPDIAARISGRFDARRYLQRETGIDVVQIDVLVARHPHIDRAVRSQHRFHVVQREDLRARQHACLAGVFQRVNLREQVLRRVADQGGEIQSGRHARRCRKRRRSEAQRRVDGAGGPADTPVRTAPCHAERTRRARRHVDHDSVDLDQLLRLVEHRDGALVVRHHRREVVDHHRVGARVGNDVASRGRHAGLIGPARLSRCRIGQRWWRAVAIGRRAAGQSQAAQARQRRRTAARAAGVGASFGARAGSARRGGLPTVDHDPPQQRGHPGHHLVLRAHRIVHVLRLRVAQRENADLGLIERRLSGTLLLRLVDRVSHRIDKGRRAGNPRGRRRIPDRQTRVVQIEVAQQRRNRFAGHRRKRNHPAAHAGSGRDMHRLAVEIPDQAVGLDQLHEHVAGRVVETTVDRALHVTGDIRGQSFHRQHVTQHVRQRRTVRRIVNRRAVPRRRDGLSLGDLQHRPHHREPASHLEHGSASHARWRGLRSTSALLIGRIIAARDKHRNFLATLY